MMAIVVGKEVKDYLKEKLKGFCWNRSPAVGFIYFAKVINNGESGKYIKIGTSSGDYIIESCNRRIVSLQCGCPYEIALAHCFAAKDAYKEEACLHRIFKSANVRGEWFDTGKFDAYQKKIYDLALKFVGSGFIVNVLGAWDAEVSEQAKKIHKSMREKFEDTNI